jgi:hypothetical protein
MDIIGSATLTSLLTPSAIDADGVTAGLDCNSLNGQGAIIMTALPTGGTLPTMAVKLQHAQDGDVVTSVTPNVGNTGNGTFTQVYGGPDAVAENITITFSNATTATVVGSVTGPLANLTVGTLYQSSKIELLVTAGSAAFVNTDSCVIVTTARTYADVAGGAFTGLTTARSIQKNALNFDKLGRYLRVHDDVGGTDPTYTAAVFAISDVK